MIQIPIGDDKVISITEVRESRRIRQMSGRCQHAKIVLDTTLVNIFCEDCNQYLCPVEWIAMLIQHWQFYVDAANRYQAAREALEGKRRTKCDHCRKMTTVRPTPTGVRS